MGWDCVSYPRHAREPATTMMIYERGNAAKQWMLGELERRFCARGASASGGGHVDVRVLDLACGNGHKWSSFVVSHPEWCVVGVDTDAVAVGRGRWEFQGVPQVDLRVLDAQRPVEEGTFDAVVAMSAIEHVVDRPAFLKTVWTALKPGGVAYLNYDA